MILFRAGTAPAAPGTAAAAAFSRLFRFAFASDDEKYDQSKYKQ